jgi:hypothetical protein
MPLDVSCTYTSPITLSKASVYNTLKDTQNLVVLAIEQKTLLFSNYQKLIDIHLSIHTFSFSLTNQIRVAFLLVIDY